MPDDIPLLPIKVVLRREEDFVRPRAHPVGERKLFSEVDDRFRQGLLSQLDGVRRHFARSFEERPDVPAVARVSLQNLALAKSHRPASLFERDTCPIIGVETFGRVLVRATPRGLDALGERIARGDTLDLRADMSTITEIRPYEVDTSVYSGGYYELVTQGRSLENVKVRVFEHHDSAANSAVLRALVEQVEELGLPALEEVYYADRLRIFCLPKVTAEALSYLSRFVSVQSLTPFPAYGAVRTRATALRAAKSVDLPPPEPGRTYPLVGMVDTGTRLGDPLLGPWVAARHVYVPPADQDNDHGSFVAGMLIRASGLNHGDDRLSDHAVRIVDVVALDRRGSIDERQLLAILEEVIPLHPEVRIWNLSLGTDDLCTDRVFSDLAVALDRLADRHDVVFIVAAGNYGGHPLRVWPPPDLGEVDRICPPADTARGLTVGALAHLDRFGALVKREEPAPFSRRGPGAAFLPKPEVAQYGGNCDATGQHSQMGLRSLDGHGNLVEDVGTSFASPQTAGLVANLDTVVTGHPTASMLKALTVHSALLRSGGILRASDLRYRGFGLPGTLASVLHCHPWMSTLVFEPELPTGQEFEKIDFPMPSCLFTAAGKLRAEIFMTLVYDPPLDPSYGAEYCRTNVDISLGTYDFGVDGKRHHECQVPAMPRDFNKLYEHHVIEHGFKWSPVKVYHRRMPQGVAGQRWRLCATVRHRKDFQATHHQEITLLVTIADLDRRVPVYSDVAALMAKQRWVTQNLQVSPRLRVR